MPTNSNIDNKTRTNLYDLSNVHRDCFFPYFQWYTRVRMRMHSSRYAHPAASVGPLVTFRKTDEHGAIRVCRSRCSLATWRR